MVGEVPPDATAASVVDVGTAACPVQGGNAGGEKVARLNAATDGVVASTGTVPGGAHGRGIPVGIDPGCGISGGTLMMTNLRAGGKIDSSLDRGSGGRHGVGG